MPLKVDVSALLTALRMTGAGLRGMAFGTVQQEIVEAMRAEGERLLLATFDTQTAPDGSAWVPAARNYGHPLLNATGEMRSSAHCVIGSRDDASGFSLSFSVDDEKAVWHQFGTYRGGPTSSPLRAQNRKSGRATMSGVTSAFHEGAERKHIPARKMIFDEGEVPAPWVASLEAVGQAALDRFLTARITL